MESDAQAFINNHILICSVWFLFNLIKSWQTRHTVVGGWFILSSVYWIILVCVLSDRSIEGKPQRTFLLNSLDKAKKKKIVVFQVPCQKKTGSVGRLYFFFFF